MSGTNPLRYAMGLGPLYLAMAIPLALMLIIGAVSWHTMRYGPSYPVAALSDSVHIEPHRNDADYASAIAERFLSQHLIYHHNSFTVAQSRAAFLCTQEYGQDLLRAARNRQNRVDQTKESSQMEVLASKVVWEGDGEYIIAVLIQRQRWYGPLQRETELQKATVHLVPRRDEDVRIFMMAVASSRVDPYQPAETPSDTKESA